MGLFDSLKDLVNEHGSATILKERIALAEDKYKELERKLANETIRANIAEQRCQDLIQECEELKNSVVRPPAEITDETISVLRCIAKFPKLTAAQLAANTPHTAERILYHLELLMEMGFSERILSGSQRDFIWKLAQPGRSFLMDRQLLE